MISTPPRAREGNSGRGPSASGDASPESTRRRQSLRETSIVDVLVLQGQHGPIGPSVSRRSNTMNGGAVNFTSMQGREPEGYGTAVASSSTPRGRSQSTPEAPVVVFSDVPSPGVAAFLAGPTTIFMTAERSVVNADPSRPSFLYSIVPRPDNPCEWNEVILARFRLFTFIISSTADLHFAAAMLAAPALPWAFHHITRVVFPKMYWFSGVAHNRQHNPFFVFASQLPLLAQLSFTLHTAGLTTSCFGERQMITLERSDPVRAKERKVKSLQDVVAQYDLGHLFLCPGLQRVRVEYISCEMISFFTRVGRPADLLREIQAFLVNGFAGHGLNVHVELVQVEG